ncbi:MAG: formylglycine-generating enzyme family protein [Candidatus Cloacimonadaceae bacterium]|jgi:sulfatase modifying factor 1
MRKMSFILITIAAAMLILTAMSCKKTTEPNVDLPAGMVLVKGGTFTMGNARNADNEFDPPHTVTLNSFYIGKYEVTQAEFSKYMQPGEPWNEMLGLGDNYPAYNVSWFAALKYCNLRSIAEGLTPCYTIAGSTNPADWGEVPDHLDESNSQSWDAATCNWKANGYRLPTEAEWEYAARGRTNNPDYLFSGSNDSGAVGWFVDNGEGIHPVGQKAANSIGTYDMSGNLSEWCWDRYSDTYYSTSPQNNPTGPTEGYVRVERGGNWHYISEMCHVYSRGMNIPDISAPILGFRVCRTK